MRIPDSFKKALAQVFYDKDMQLCKKVTQTDELGAVVGVGYEPILSFRGSFQPTMSDGDVVEYGQGTQATFRIACSVFPDAFVKGEHVVLYNEKYYEISGIFPQDSATILMVTEAGR